MLFYLFSPWSNCYVRPCTWFSNGWRQIEAFHFAGDVFGFEVGSVQSLSAKAVCDCTVLSYHWSGPGMPPASERLLHQLLLHAMAGHAQAQRHSIMLGRGSAMEKVADPMSSFRPCRDAQSGSIFQQV